MRTATEQPIDKTKYRVSLVCACNNDMAYGYGPTVEEARANAIRFFRKAPHHGREKWTTEIVEEAVTTAGGSSHYELLEGGV